MATYTYLDWCPVSAVPLTLNLTEEYEIEEVIKKDYMDPTQEYVDTKLFYHYPDLVSYIFTSRVDGFFIFRLETKKKISAPEIKEIANHVSDFIKHKLGHRHEFHNNYSPYHEPSSFIYRITPKTLKRLFLKNDKYFFVAPIQIDENKLPVSELVLPEVFKKIKATPNRENKYFNKIAYLSLYSFYSKKKQRFFDLHKKELGASVLIEASILPITFFLISGLFFSSYIPVVLSICIFLYIYFKKVSEKLTLIHRAIGYFNYVDIYSKIIISLLKDSEQSKEISIGFSNIIGCLEAKAKIEENNIRNQRYTWGVFFALTAISVGILRLMAIYKIS